MLFFVFQRAIITQSVDSLRTIFPRLEQSLPGIIRGADLGKCLKGTEFQFKKKRIMFLRLLKTDSQVAKSINADLARSVADAVLNQQDDESALAVLDKFRKDNKDIASLFGRGEGGLWEKANERAKKSSSNSNFLVTLHNTPAGDDLHEAAVEAEEKAYALLRKEVDDSVSDISTKILSTQKGELDKHIQREVAELGSDEAREIQIPWSKFVRKVKDASTKHASSYVPCGVRNALTT